MLYVLNNYTVSLIRYEQPISCTKQNPVLKESGWSWLFQFQWQCSQDKVTQKEVERPIILPTVSETIMKLLRFTHQRNKTHVFCCALACYKQLCCIFYKRVFQVYGDRR